MDKKNNEPMLPMMDFNDEPNPNNTTLSFIDSDDEPQEERVPTNCPLRFNQNDEDITTEQPKPKPAVAVQQPAAERPAAVQQPKEQQPTAERPAAVQQPKEQQPTQQPQTQPKPQSTPKSNNQNEDAKTPIPKAIKLNVVNCAGVSLQSFNVNGKPVDNGQTITFRDEREIYELIISADGYKDRRIQITRSDRQKGEKRIGLVSQAQSLIVSFSTPEGVKRGSIDIEQTSSIYEYMKEASHTDTPLNMFNINGVGGSSTDPSKKLSLHPFIIVFVVGILLGWGVTALFMGGSSDDEADQTEYVEDVADNNDENPTIAENNTETQPVETLEPEKEETTKEEVKEEEQKEETTAEPKLEIPERDVKYLKEAQGEIWKTSQMQSEACRKMMSAFAKGDIEYILSSANAYNSVPENKRNGYYNKLLRDFNVLKGQSNYDDVKKTLASECRNGNFNLRELLDKMHRMLK